MEKIFINIGNTWTILSWQNKEKKYPTNKLSENINLFYDKAMVAFIASVVPEINLFFLKYFEEVHFLSAKNSRLDLSLVEEAQTIGADRLANIIAVNYLYKSSCLVIDCGSCFSGELINQYKQFIGGFIFPGRQLQRDILKLKTGQLPKLKVKEFNSIFFGKTTKQAIELGIDYGILGCLELFIKQCKKEYLISNICFTGGDGLLYSKYFQGIDYYQKLTLEGLKKWSTLV